MNTETRSEKTLLQEVEYWQAAFDRLRADFLALRKSHDDWKDAHDNAVKKINQWEEWYKSAEADRDRYKQWDLDKKLEIERLNASLVRFNQTLDVWKSDNRKLVALVEQRDAEVKNLLERLKSMEEDRDRFKKWDEDKKSHIDHVEQMAKELVQARSFWQEEHRKLEEQVKHWVALYEEIQGDRDRYRQWDLDKKSTIEQKDHEITLKQEEIANLRQRIETLFDHPLHYCRMLFRRKFKRTE